MNITRESPLSIPMIMNSHWKAKEPFHLIGEPSTVKSALIKQTAANICKQENEGREFVEWSKVPLDKKMQINADPLKYFIFEDLRASETDIGELRLQEMTTAGNYITYKYSLLFVVLSNPNAKGVLFFDEMNLASNLVKAQFYKVYNDKSIGDMPLSENVLICSAGNEQSQVPDVVNDSVALITRRGNYFLRPLNKDEFVNYAYDVGLHRSIIGYVSFAPQDIHDLKYDFPDPIGQPCARTWEKLSRIVASNPDMKMDERSIIARGLLGQGTAGKYISFSKLDESLDLETFIKTPEKVKDIKDIQILHALITGMISLYKERGDKMFPVICHISCNIKEELGIYMFKQFKRTIGDDAKFRKLAVNTYPKEWDMVFNKFSEFLK